MTGARGPLFFFCAFLFILVPSLAQAAVTSQDCLDCHDNAKTYAHGSVSCTDCHADIKELPHEEKLKKPACATCHDDTVRAFQESVHGKKNMACKKCHDVHAPAKEKKQCASCHPNVSHEAIPSQQKHFTALTCTACHTKVAKSEIALKLLFKDKKQVLDRKSIDADMNGRLDEAEWHNLEHTLASKGAPAHDLEKIYRVQGDVHAVMKKPALCADCHEKRNYFPSAKLQVKDGTSYELTVDPAALIPEIPSIEAYTQTLHGRKGVQCADCHIGQRRIAEGGCENCTICVKCHQDVQNVYKESIHAKKGATHCSDCHNPHKVKPYKELNARERVAVCSRCHKDYIAKHAWLPNTSLHFDYLECTTCHSPQSTKSMVFFMARRENGKRTPLDHNTLVKLFGGSSEPLKFIEESGHGPITQEQIARLFADLRKRDDKIFIDASIIVTKVHHDYSVTRLKERECVTCHSRNAAFYDSLFFTLPAKDTVRYVPVKETPLSVYPLATAVDIFLLGEEKITMADVRALLGAANQGVIPYAAQLGYKWVDLLGFILMAAVILGVLLHLVLRAVAKL